MLKSTDRFDLALPIINQLHNVIYLVLPNGNMGFWAAMARIHIMWSIKEFTVYFNKTIADSMRFSALSHEMQFATDLRVALLRFSHERKK